MRRGTTPTNTSEVDRDLTEARIFVTYSQNGRVVFEKTGDDLVVDESSIKCTLSQEDTLALADGIVEIQIRYITELGKADASEIIRTSAEHILKDGEITYEEEVDDGV